MTGIGFLEALLLAETGSRANDGNFLWGYSFAIFYIFVLSFGKWVDMWKTATDKQQSGKDGNKLYYILFGLCGVVFAYQLYCGIVFFMRLLFGETYFMMG